MSHRHQRHIFPPPSNVILLNIPPEKTLCVGHSMEIPYLAIADPLTHILEVRIETWVEPSPEPPELIVTLLIPNKVNRLYRFLIDAYLSSTPSIPVLMEDRIPNLAPNSLPISCMVWNVQGVGSRAFMAALREVVRVNKPNVIALVETHMGGAQAEKIAALIKYNGHTRVDAQGFSGGIWIFWDPDVVSVNPIIKHGQYITMDI